MNDYFRNECQFTEYQQGQLYTAEKLEQLTGRDQVNIYDWASKLDTINF